jgi:hypothetical protein
MRLATALLYHVCTVASRNIRFASCGTSGNLTLWTRYVALAEGGEGMMGQKRSWIALIERDHQTDKKSW